MIYCYIAYHPKTEWLKTSQVAGVGAETSNIASSLSLYAASPLAGSELLPRLVDSEESSKNTKAEGADVLRPSLKS